VIGAHPDDPDFGSAGVSTIWAEEGREVVWLVCTRGHKGSADLAMTSERLAQQREQEERAAAAILGVREVVFLDEIDGEVTVNLRFRGELTRAIRFYRPDIVLTHDPTVVIHGNEFLNHPDHRAVGQTALDAIYPTARDHLQFPEHLREGLHPHKVREIWLWGTEHPNEVVDITAVMDRKIEALRQHRSQFPDFAAVEQRLRERSRLLGEPHGFEYAEAFRRVRMRA